MNKMKVDLFFCGDSFTYGAELQGLEEDHEKREKQRFSTLVSDKLGMTHDNVSKNGACNDWIVKTVVDWFESGNECHTAFIQFSGYRRWGWYDKKRKYHFMPEGRWDDANHHYLKTEEQRNAFKTYDQLLYSEETHLDNYWKNKFFLVNYLKDKCKVHFMTLRKVPYGKDKNYKTNYWYNLVKNIEITELSPLVDKQLAPRLNETNLRGGHPSSQGHEQIANYLLGLYSMGSPQNSGS